MKITLPEHVDNLTYYTGVGSRNTPPHILSLMENLSRMFPASYVLRSGGAQGADAAFERGAKHSVIYYANDTTAEAMRIAALFHPAWERCSHYAKLLHGRNAFQVLGDDLKTPSKFLICWTPDGATSHQERTIATGGTGTAISIASANAIKVNNLQRPDHFAIATSWLAKK